jgi:hypothetical protein
MKIRHVAAIFAVPVIVFSFALAQSPAPQYSTAEKGFIVAQEQIKQAAQKQYNDAQQAEMQMANEFHANHPGYHVNPQTWAIEPDAPAEAPKTAPAKK